MAKTDPLRKKAFESFSLNLDCPIEDLEKEGLVVANQTEKEITLVKVMSLNASENEFPITYTISFVIELETSTSTSGCLYMQGLETGNPLLEDAPIEVVKKIFDCLIKWSALGIVNIIDEKKVKHYLENNILN